ncbi:MAG TPA: GNAT family N-acetyltransferase [Povalibacter sp.]
MPTFTSSNWPRPDGQHPAGCGERRETILELQQLAYQSEAKLYEDWTVPPLTQSLASLREELAASVVVLKAEMAGRIVGSVRATASGDSCTIGRLIVHPQCQRRGIGSLLMREIETVFANACRYELFTGSRSDSNIRLYQHLGYTIFRTQALSPAVELVFMEKHNEAPAGKPAAPDA